MVIIRTPKFQMDRFPAHSTFGLCAKDLSKNEINNLIYMFLRYGYQFNSERHAEPVNSDIAKIMKAIGTDITKERLIRETVKFVKATYDLTHLVHDDMTADDVERHLEKLYNQFFMLPNSLRGNLGEDSDSYEFLDKN